MKQIDELAKRMKRVNLSELARRCDMARPHITDIAHGRVNNMRITTYAKLTAALDDMETKRGWVTCDAVQHSDQMVCQLCGVTWDAGDPDGPIDLCGKTEAQ